MELTILVENTTLIDHYYKGEPGFCCLLEDGEEKILLDTGYSGLRRAIRDLNSNDPFVGDVSAILENGVATSIIFNCTAPDSGFDEGEETPGNGGKYSREVDTSAVSSTLGLVDFSDSTKYNINASYQITAFNYIDGANLPNMVTDYLLYLGYTDIGNLSFASPNYSITATDPSGIDVTVTMNSSVIGTTIKEVQIDGDVYYAESTEDIVDLLGTVTGTYARCSDGTYADVNTPSDLDSQKSYTTGYYKVSLNGTPLVTSTGGAFNTGAARVGLVGADANGDVYVNGDETVVVEITATANSTYTIAANALDYTAVDTNSSGFTVAPSTAADVAHNAITDSSTVTFRVNVVLDDYSSASDDVVLQINLTI